MESTNWSVVLRARGPSSPAAREALADLCGTYWYPLYGYLRRRGHAAHEAQDLVQGFFVHLLDRNAIAAVDPARGRFRSFLLTALNHFIAHQREKDHALKRGGGVPLLSIDVTLGETRYAQEPAHDLTPEKLYRRQWAATLLDHVLARLRAEYVAAGKEAQFDGLKAYLVRGDAEGTYAEVAATLHMSPAAAMTAASRLRRRYRELLLAEIARTVDHPDEVEDEVRRLFEALAG